MATENLPLVDMGAEFELLGRNIQAAGCDLREGKLDASAAIEVLAGEFKSLRAEFEALTAKAARDA